MRLAVGGWRLGRPTRSRRKRGDVDPDNFTLLHFYAKTSPLTHRCGFRPATSVSFLRAPRVGPVSNRGPYVPSSRAPRSLAPSVYFPAALFSPRPSVGVVGGPWVTRVVELCRLVGGEVELGGTEVVDELFKGAGT